jgi:hypothetical protein
MACRQAIFDRVLDPVIRLVPASRREVDATQEAEAVVDRDEFLMVAAAHRMAKIESAS